MARSGSITRAARTKGGEYHKNNVMTPLNWFVAIAEAALMSGVILSDNLFVKVACLSLVVLVLLFYAYVYRYFMMKDPNRLQSEGYNLKTQELSLFSHDLDAPFGLTITNQEKVLAPSQEIKEVPMLPVATHDSNSTGTSNKP
jgi:hypothetical protein